MRVSDQDAEVIVQALSRCAAERRIAQSRAVDPEVRSFQDAQARRYESVLARLRAAPLRPSEGLSLRRN